MPREKMILRGNEAESPEQSREWLADHEYFMSFELPSASADHGAHVGMQETMRTVMEKDENIGAFLESDSGDEIDDLKTEWVVGGIDDDDKMTLGKLATAYANFMKAHEGEVYDGRFTDYAVAKEEEKKKRLENLN
jgi:hypothetical protein